ncbi:MAG TPA: DUF6797 domain-containing protein [Candidatus Limnocylindria bacterium]|nr:DUF6797 domain-containing protein [Candidatus Limnocylindria bacterium]
MSPRLRRLFPALAVMALALPAVTGQAQEKYRMLQDDFPFQGACINAKFPANNIALKGLAIHVGNGANMLFDTDLCRMAAGWTGGFITTHGVAFDGAHGHHPAITGEQKFGTAQVPGVAGADGEFKDTREVKFGPMDKSVSHWGGLYVNGNDVLLTYTVGGSTKISEQPGSVAADGQVAFTRTFKLDAPSSGFLFFRSHKVAQPFSLLVADVEGGTAKVEDSVVTFSANGVVTKVSAVGLPKGASLNVDGGRVSLKVAKGTPSGTFKLVIWSGAAADAGKFAQLAAGAPMLKDFAHGGALRWTETIKTNGVLATSATPDGAYVTDTIATPETNPWNRRVRFGGFDFFSDGKRAAFCTHDGDIWIVSGIDEKLDHLEWRRFASGMYETLGLAIVNDVIYTSGRDQITRYHDLNGDGEADYYENFNNDYMSSEGFHEFVFDFQHDDAGNFYFAKANPVNGGGRGFGDQKASQGNGTVSPHAGCLFKLSPDGKKLEIIARGLRAPNGIGVRGDGQVTTSDNEGTWVPSTPINWVKPGNFLGVVNNLTTKELADSWTPPLTWLSHNDYDNSGGGQIWVTSDKWGPFKGELLHESYGRSSLFLVMKQPISGGRMQGGVVRFPLKFTSSVMRAHFNPKDGQLYVAGLSEWQSNASRITGFDRVRYTGKPVYSVRDVKAVAGGVVLTFTQPLDAASVGDLQNWSGKRWNYERAEHYGSPEYQVNNPQKQGREPIDITSAKLSPDGMSVTLGITDFKPVMQEAIKWDIKAKDGTPVAQEIQHTVHVVPVAASSLN